MAESCAYRGGIATDQNKFTDGIAFYKRGLSYCDRRTDSAGLVLKRNLNRNLGLIYSNQGNFGEANKCLITALQLAEKMRDTSALISTIVVYGQVCKEQGRYDEAIKILYRGLALAEHKKDEAGQGRLLNNMANVYVGMHKFSDAVQFYLRALTIKKKLNVKGDIANTYGNIGVAYYQMLDFEKALLYYDSSLVIKREIDDRRGTATTLHNIGLLYLEQKKLKLAKKYIEEGLEIRKALKDWKGTASSSIGLGRVYVAEKQCSKAIPMLEEGAGIARQYQARETYENALLYLSEAHACNGNYKLAYQYAEEYRLLHDSIITESNRKQAQEMKSLYESDKQQAEINQLKKERALSEIQSLLQRDRDQQKTYFWIALTALFVLIVAFLIIRSKENKKAQEKIQAAYNVIEAKNKDITASISYAKLIQESVLPPKALLTESFPESFVLYMPKDIVSGDFWWMKKLTDNKIALAVGDCTGHGVPGAFMSVLCSELLTHGTELMPDCTTATLLDFVHHGILRHRQNNEHSGQHQDGMDIALIIIDKTTGWCQFSGANRPLLWINDNTTVKQPATKVALGSLEYRSVETIEFNLSSSDSLYMYTDGFGDQFGGPSGKKYRSGALQDVLTKISSAPATEQHELLESAYLAWKGNLEQVDDVCILGVKWG